MDYMVLATLCVSAIVLFVQLRVLDNSVWRARNTLARHIEAHDEQMDRRMTLMRYAIEDMDKRVDSIRHKVLTPLDLAVEDEPVKLASAYREPPRCPGCNRPAQEPDNA